MTKLIQDLANLRNVRQITLNWIRWQDNKVNNASKIALYVDVDRMTTFIVYEEFVVVFETNVRYMNDYRRLCHAILNSLLNLFYRISFATTNKNNINFSYEQAKNDKINQYYKIIRFTSNLLNICDRSSIII